MGIQESACDLYQYSNLPTVGVVHWAQRAVWMPSGRKPASAIFQSVFAQPHAGSAMNLQFVPVQKVYLRSRGDTVPVCKGVHFQPQQLPAAKGWSGSLIQQG